MLEDFRSCERDVGVYAQQPSTWRKLGNRQPKDSCREMEQIDVAVLTKNSAKTIAKSLDAIKRSIDFSKLVVIDDSDDRGETLRIASKYTNQIYVFSGNIGEARDYAIDLVIAPIFAFVDSDVIVNRAAFLRSMEILRSDQLIAAVHSPYRSTDPRVSFGQYAKQKSHIWLCPPSNGSPQGK
jgi:glycosyltransferase involved in cell wall biosynthesis